MSTRTLYAAVRLVAQGLGALEVIFNEMHYINLRFTYLLIYLLADGKVGLTVA